MLIFQRQILERTELLQTRDFLFVMGLLIAFFYCVKYHYVILTIAVCWREQTSTTRSNIFKRNILVSALHICELRMHRAPSSPV